MLWCVSFVSLLCDRRFFLPVLLLIVYLYISIVVVDSGWFDTVFPANISTYSPFPYVVSTMAHRFSIQIENRWWLAAGKIYISVCSDTHSNEVVNERQFILYFTLVLKTPNGQVIYQTASDDGVSNDLFWLNGRRKKNVKWKWNKLFGFDNVLIVDSLLRFNEDETMFWGATIVVWVNGMNFENKTN